MKLITDYNRLLKVLLLFNFIDYIATKLSIYFNIGDELNPIMIDLFAHNNIFYEIGFKIIYVSLALYLFVYGTKKLNESGFFDKHNTMKNFYILTQYFILISYFSLITIHLFNFIVWWWYK